MVVVLPCVQAGTIPQNFHSEKRSQCMWMQPGSLGSLSIFVQALYLYSEPREVQRSERISNFEERGAGAACTTLISLLPSEATAVVQVAVRRKSYSTCSEKDRVTCQPHGCCHPEA